MSDQNDESSEDQTDFQFICAGVKKCEIPDSIQAREDFMGCEWCIKIYWDQFGNKTEIGPGNA